MISWEGAWEICVLGATKTKRATCVSPVEERYETPIFRSGYLHGICLNRARNWDTAAPDQTKSNPGAGRFAFRLKKSVDTVYPEDIYKVYPRDIQEAEIMARKRMILSLDDDLHSVLMDLAKETGNPAASFVVELLEETKPRLIELLKMVKLAKQRAVDEARNVLIDMTSTAQSQIDELRQELTNSEKAHKVTPSEKDRS